MQVMCGGKREKEKQRPIRMNFKGFSHLKCVPCVLLVNHYNKGLKVWLA